ncbi:hypothetical protein KAR91_22475 [Candidatus Pacearchaeota archaeon]|nr:hypothetical protein [Candidatus Pacearchaeota archaeon]
MQHIRESRGVKELIKQKRKAEKEVEKLKQQRIQKEIKLLRRVAFNLSDIFPRLGFEREWFFEMNLINYWKQNRKLTRLKY